MKYRMLGQTGYRVSEIGFGTWGLGGSSYGPVDDSQAKSALRLGFEKGINLFDTADLYGDGRSEELLGEVFANQRKDIVIVSKGGTLPHCTFDMPQDFSAAYLRKALEASLRRLKTDYIDVYLLHSPAIEVIRCKEVMLTLQAFKKEGKVICFGVSARSPQDALEAIQGQGFSVIEVNFNLIDQRALEIGLFEEAAEKKAGVIVRTPLVFGFLAGGLKADKKFEKGDHRANWPREQLERWAAAPELFSFLLENRKASFAQIALRFCLDFASVSTVIPGMLNVNQVSENAFAPDILGLTEKELLRIREIYRTHDFYDKNAKANVSSRSRRDY